jgi:hypothetical protein
MWKVHAWENVHSTSLAFVRDAEELRKRLQLGHVYQIVKNNR